MPTSVCGLACSRLLLVACVNCCNSVELCACETWTWILKNSDKQRIWSCVVSVCNRVRGWVDEVVLFCHVSVCR